MRGVRLGVAALACAAICAVPAAAAAQPPAGAAEKGRTSLRIVTKSQKKLIRKGAVVKVTSTRKRVKLRLRSSTFDNQRLTALAPIKRVRLRKHGKTTKRKVKIRLSASAREALRSCEPRELQVTARGSKITIPMSTTSPTAGYSTGCPRLVWP